VWVKKEGKAGEEVVIGDWRVAGRESGGGEKAMIWKISVQRVRGVCFFGRGKEVRLNKSEFQRVGCT